MATSHNLDEINKEISQDMCMFMKVKGQSMIWLQSFAKAMLNLDMHKEICGHMQALIYEPARMHGVGELERGLLITRL